MELIALDSTPVVIAGAKFVKWIDETSFLVRYKNYLRKFTIDPALPEGTQITLDWTVHVVYANDGVYNSYDVAINSQATVAFAFISYADTYPDPNGYIVHVKAFDLSDGTELYSVISTNWGHSICCDGTNLFVVTNYNPIITTVYNSLDTIGVSQIFSETNSTLPHSYRFHYSNNLLIRNHFYNSSLDTNGTAPCVFTGSAITVGTAVSIPTIQKTAYLELHTATSTSFWEGQVITIQQIDRSQSWYAIYDGQGAVIVPPESDYDAWFLITYVANGTAVCLPYSVNGYQIREAFFDGEKLYVICNPALTAVYSEYTYWNEEIQEEVTDQYYTFPDNTAGKQLRVYSIANGALVFETSTMISSDTAGGINASNIF